MPRPKPEIARVQIALRFKPDTLAMIDAARGEASRADYIEGKLYPVNYRIATDTELSKSRHSLRTGNAKAAAAYGSPISTAK